MIPDRTAAPAVPRSFAALRRPGYGAYLLTGTLAMMADNIEHVISYWVIFEKFRSPMLGGVAVLTHWLPFLLFSVYSGALADRFDNRRLIQAAMLMYMAVSAGWALLFLTDTIQEWHAVVLLTVHGLAGVLWGPASQILIYDIVGPAELQSAVRLNATGRNLGILMGPAVGGGLLLVFGPAVGLFVNVLIYVPLLWWLQRVGYGEQRRQELQRAPRAGAREGGFTAMLGIMRQVSGNRTIVSMLLLVGVSSFFVGHAYQAQMPEYAHDLGTQEEHLSYSILLASSAAGALAGGLILESRALLRSSPRTAILLTIVWCAAITGFAVTTSYPLAVALMFVAGFLQLAYSSMAQALVQVEAPPHLRGRVIGLFNMSMNGLRAFSGITVGFLGSLIGIHWSLALSALALLAATVALLPFAMRSKSP